MKINLKVVSLGMLFAVTCVSGVVFADCPAQLTVEDRISCIRMEGGGFSYQAYLAERSEIIANAQKARGLSANQDSAARGPGSQPKE